MSACLLKNVDFLKWKPIPTAEVSLVRKGVLSSGVSPCNMLGGKSRSRSLLVSLNKVLLLKNIDYLAISGECVFTERGGETSQNLSIYLSIQTQPVVDYPSKKLT